jgi:phosphoglycolate phosphatase-like HAD superfamily hydrolase
MVRAVPRAVIFDFDGVILESADIKTDAFLRLFWRYPEHHAAIRAYHLENQGISRYVKFKWIYRELLEKELRDADLLELGSRFSELVMEGIRTCAAVPGAIQLLTRLQPCAPCFVASGTPHDELLDIIRMRGLDGYFKGVWGSPAAKADILRTIMEANALRAAELLFVGDGISDYNAAREAGVPFIARDTGALRSRWRELGVACVRDLYGLERELFGAGSAAIA